MTVELEPTHGDEAPPSRGGNIIKRERRRFPGIQMLPLSWKWVPPYWSLCVSVCVCSSLCPPCIVWSSLDGKYSDGSIDHAVDVSACWSLAAHFRDLWNLCWLNVSVFSSSDTKNESFNCIGMFVSHMTSVYGKKKTCRCKLTGSQWQVVNWFHVNTLDK